MFPIGSRYVQEDIELNRTDPYYREFSKIFQAFKVGSFTFNFKLCDQVLLQMWRYTICCSWSIRTRLQKKQKRRKFLKKTSRRKRRKPLQSTRPTKTAIRKACVSICSLLIGWEMTSEFILFLLISPEKANRRRRKEDVEKKAKETESPECCWAEAG